MRRRFDAVIFDLDGVITDTAAYHYLAWKRLADELDIYFDAEINESLKGVDRMASLEIVLKNSDKKFSEAEKSELADRKNSYYRELLSKMTPKDILPGVIDVLKKLKGQNIKTALASASKNAFMVVDKLELRGYFDYIVDARLIKKGKPDPEIFLTAAEHLDTPPERCIGVEDARAGIIAIKAAGMYSVGIGDKSLGADDVISSLEYFDIDKYQNPDAF